MFETQPNRIRRSLSFFHAIQYYFFHLYRNVLMHNIICHNWDSPARPRLGLRL